MLNGAKLLNTPSTYPGPRYQRADGTEFGIRVSAKEGITLSITKSNNPSLPTTFKIHQQ